MTTTIPVLDMSRYSLDVVSQEVDTQTIRSLAESLCGAFRDVGFCYITNHGFKQSLIDRTMEVACTFFEMPVEYKNMYRRPSDAFYGWIPQGTESLNQVNRFDYKEAYNYPPVDGTELIPDVKDYKVTMEEFRASCYTLGHRLFDLMSVGMALEDRDFLRKCHTLLGKKGNTSGLRSIYYPPLPPNKDIKPNQVRCGEHSDYGSLTLLFQDDAGGLEVV
ncbi:UPF0676 protein C1494.01-like [Mizuhopecten yessoensis]|uniref:Non-haem dioxygenase N-terminal domain-containing protein n=1 Tax=Mizuhopecten yessoensis TaxID=6573 RepID=A0A210QUQ4_MIZYE|nr:UPF0676 protein C1494.01-like [Mizuhopecten yessoensis]OWF52503.1 hypothetical protein KP79_PYT06840 [Mizuhopecten yessoensis]